jgi:hypothetical protein
MKIWHFEPIFIDLFNLHKPFGGVGSSFDGFPFTYYFSTCFGGGYYYSGLVSNILFAGLVSFFIGLFLSFIWARFVTPTLIKVSSPEFQAKWHL